jgi:hypothetical protein
MIGPMRAAAIGFVVAMVLHGIDHLMQDRGVGALAPEVVWGGTVLFVLAFGTLALIVTEHPRAALAATVTGFWTAIAVSLSHLAPHWSAFSDPYPDLGLGAWSWIVMLSEVAMGVVLGIAGARALQRSRSAVAA